MGYDKHRVESLLEEIDESLTLEEKTREAIKKLATT